MMVNKNSNPILIIEDSDDDYEYLQWSFKKSEINNTVHRCINGQDGMDYLEKKGTYNDRKTSNPSIIFLDLNLPGMDGREVLKLIKTNDTLKMIPIIVLTTSNNENDISHCYSNGANTYVQKPIQTNSFVDSVRRIKEYWLELSILPN